MAKGKRTERTMAKTGEKAMLELPEKKLLRPDEVATYFSVSRSTIYLWVEHGQLEAAKLTDGVLRVTLDSVKAFEQRGMMRAAQSSF